MNVAYKQTIQKIVMTFTKSLILSPEKLLNYIPYSLEIYFDE